MNCNHGKFNFRVIQMAHQRASALRTPCLNLICPSLMALGCVSPLLSRPNMVVAQ